MDITTCDETGEPWNFDRDDKKKKAIERVIETEPDLLVGSPMCKEFSPWQRLNKALSTNPEEYEERKRSAVKHLEFVCHAYEIQYNAKRLFLHEHPQQASSWEEQCIQRLLSLPGVEYIDMDQCQLGQTDESGNPVKKPTRWLSNSSHILGALAKRCEGRNGWCNSDGLWRKHTPCYGQVATAAAIYPF